VGARGERCGLRQGGHRDTVVRTGRGTSGGAGAGAGRTPGEAGWHQACPPLSARAMKFSQVRGQMSQCSSKFRSPSVVCSRM
jgi:hypothetical protein